ncbi:MAG: acetylglutamate kinase [Prevotellaceae bacterium]|nr:acetylglutamate kinase [Prevotellaceae bacterium]
MTKSGVTVIKVGGAVVEEQDKLEQLLEGFSAVPGLPASRSARQMSNGGHVVLVHGGGRSATRIASLMGIESRMVDGRRITDEPMLDVVTMVYGGLVNKRIVAKLQARGVNALGVTGADLDLIRSHKRPVGSVDYGWVGDVERADGKALSDLIYKGIVPVVAPLTHDGKGHLLNTNADTMAAQVAEALAPFFDVTLTFAFEKAGVLLDADDDTSVIPRLSHEEYLALKEKGVIAGGMIPKLDNAFEAISKGVGRVVITSASDLSGQGGTTLE